MRDRKVPATIRSAALWAGAWSVDIIEKDPVIVGVVVLGGAAGTYFLESAIGALLGVAVGLLAYLCRLFVAWILRKDQVWAAEYAQILAQESNTKASHLLQRVSRVFATSPELVQRFYEVAERKVSRLDEYGDENWNGVGPEVLTCLVKLYARALGAEASRPQDEVRKYLAQVLSAPDSTLGTDALTWKRVGQRLEEGFREYHVVREPHRAAASAINEMSGVEFETYFAQLLRDLSFVNVRGTPASGDQGADLIACKGGRTMVIQTKRYAGAVGNKAVQEVAAAVMFYGGHEGWVVTNSTFTTGARALALKAGVRLIDGSALSNLRATLKDL